MSLLIMPLSQVIKKMSLNTTKINNIFEKNPITANAVTGFITFAAGSITINVTAATAIAITIAVTITTFTIHHS